MNTLHITSGLHALRHILGRLCAFFDLEAADQRAREAYLAESGSIAEVESRQRSWERQRV